MIKSHIVMNKKISRLLLVLSIILLNIGCDQVSKKMIREEVDTDQAIHLIGDHLTITKVENTGAFLSMGNSLSVSVRHVLLSLLPLLALIGGFLYILLKPNLSTLSIVASCFIIGGGLGNVYDRFVHGSVTDFLYIQFGFLHTGVFNLADTSIMLGAGIILVQSLFQKEVG
jgi:signal peptidase II